MIFAAPQLSPEEKAVIHQIDELRSQLQYAINNNPHRWTGFLRRNALARAIQGSNSIEGYNVTVDDAVAAADNEDPIEADKETWLAIKGYRDALTYILQLADDPHFDYHEQLLRSLHFMMLGHDLSKHPGQWRPGYIRVLSEQTGETVYEGPDADLIPELISELIDSLKQDSDEPVMVRAAMAHLNLTMIHPFSDGNGRMARALQTLVLARERILSPTFCSIEEYLGKNTQHYYQVLADVGAGRWNPDRDARQWIEFCLKAHYQQAATLLRRNREVEKVWNQISDKVKVLGLNERFELALVDAAFGLRVRNSSYRNNADVSEFVAGRDLKKLVELGLLIPKGERRGRYYAGSFELLKLREQAKEGPRKIEDVRR